MVVATGVTPGVEVETGAGMGVEVATGMRSGVDVATGVTSGVDVATGVRPGVNVATGVRPGVNVATGVTAGVDVPPGVSVGVRVGATIGASDALVAVPSKGAPEDRSNARRIRAAAKHSASANTPPAAILQCRANIILLSSCPSEFSAGSRPPAKAERATQRSWAWHHPCRPAAASRPLYEPLLRQA
jgi:hypothetical protein